MLSPNIPIMVYSLYIMAFELFFSYLGNSENANMIKETAEIQKTTPNAMSMKSLLRFIFFLPIFDLQCMGF